MHQHKCDRKYQFGKLDCLIIIKKRNRVIVNAKTIVKLFYALRLVLCVSAFFLIAFCPVEML